MGLGDPADKVWPNVVRSKLCDETSEAMQRFLCPEASEALQWFLCPEASVALQGQGQGQGQEHKLFKEDEEARFPPQGVLQ